MDKMANVVHISPAEADRRDRTRRRGRTGLTGLLLALCVLLSGCGRDIRPPAAADPAAAAEPAVSATQGTEAEGVSGADSGEAGTAAPEADAASLAANYQVYPVDSGGQGITYNVPPEEEGRGEPGDVGNRADTEPPDSQAAASASTQPVEPADSSRTGGVVEPADSSGIGGASETANPAETSGTDAGTDGGTQPPSDENQDVSDNPYLDRQQGRQTAGAMDLVGKLALFLYVLASSACIGYLFYRVHKLELEKREKEDDGQQGDGPPDDGIDMQDIRRFNNTQKYDRTSETQKFDRTSETQKFDRTNETQNVSPLHNTPDYSHTNDRQDTQPPPPNPQADEIRLKLKDFKTGSNERFLMKHPGGDLVIRENQKFRPGEILYVWPKMEAMTDDGKRGRLGRLNLQSGDIKECFEIDWKVKEGNSFWVNVTPMKVIATNHPDEFKLKEHGRVTVTGI